MTMTYDVFGMCNPLYDIQAEVADEIVSELGVSKGGMFLVDEAQQRQMIARIHTHIVNSESGGSGANTMIGIAQMGGSACYTGKLGNDEHGRLYQESLSARGVHSCTASGEGVTGICVVLVSPDAERTLCTYLGICRELGPDDLDVEALRASRFLYVTGYLWDTDSQKAAVLRAMNEAKAADVPIALSLSDPFCVNRHREDFLRICEEFVDLLIGNHEEAMALTLTTSPMDAIRATERLTRRAAVTLGSDGSLVRDGSQVDALESVKVKAVDTTGAGDMFAAGLLYGLTHGRTLANSARIGGAAAAQVVANLGPRLSSLDLGDLL